MFVDVLIILNNFFHDLAAAMWFCGALTQLFIYRQLQQSDRAAGEFVFSLFHKVKKITNISLIIVLLGGVVRAINYQQYEWFPALGRGQVTLLIIKHILLLAIVFGGLFLQYSLSRKMQSKRATNS